MRKTVLLLIGFIFVFGLAGITVHKGPESMAKDKRYNAYQAYVNAVKSGKIKINLDTTYQLYDLNIGGNL